VSILYLVALAGVAIVLLAALFEAVAAVSRKPKWGESHRRHLVAVVSHDRRQGDLPFVGADRRAGGASEHAPLSDNGRRAA
jgi:hypothetical protein